MLQCVQRWLHLDMFVNTFVERLVSTWLFFRTVAEFMKQPSSLITDKFRFIELPADYYKVDKKKYLKHGASCFGTKLRARELEQAWKLETSSEWKMFFFKVPFTEKIKVGQVHQLTITIAQAPESKVPLKRWTLKRNIFSFIFFAEATFSFQSRKCW